MQLEQPHGLTQGGLHPSAGADSMAIPEQVKARSANVTVFPQPIQELSEPAARSPPAPSASRPVCRNRSDQAESYHNAEEKDAQIDRTSIGHTSRMVLRLMAIRSLSTPGPAG